MATLKGKVHLAICLVLGVWCLLPFVSCLTSTADEPHNQTSESVTTSPFQGPTVQSITDITTDIQLADGGTTAVTERNSCHTTLENGPTNKTRFEGERVPLTCDFNNNNTCNILWRFSNGTDNRRTSNNSIYIDPFDKVYYNTIIKNVRQIYKLVIKSISLHRDSGIYECGYKYVSGEKFIPLASAMITVLTRPHCELHLLPPSRSDEERDFEVVCSWMPGHAGVAHFETSRDTVIAIDLTFTDRIISRIKSQDTPDITCRLTSNSDASKNTTAPCTITTGLVRVEPFINEVAIGSNASFVCSSNNQTYSWESWNIGLDRILSNGSKDRVFKNGNTLSIVNVSESDQSLLVECSLQEPGTVKISSYGALRIVEVTTPYLQTQDYDNPTHSATDGISESAHEVSQSNSRPTVVTHTLPLATKVGVGTQQTTGAPICKLHVLPSLRLPLDRDYEVVCSWTHSQVNRARFERSSGEIIDVDIKFPDHIISRVDTRSASNISCQLSLNTNPSLSISTPCIKDDTKPRFIRVDPFISEVEVGSTVVFNCTFNKDRSRSGLSWNVNSVGNTSIANTEQKNVHPDVTFVVHEHEGKRYMLVECHIQLSSIYNYDNSSSYGALRVVEATTPKLPTTPGEGRTSEITDSPSHGTVELTKNRNTVSEIQAGHITELTTPKPPTSDLTDNQTVGADEFTTDQNTFIETQPRVEVTTPKCSSEIGEQTDKGTVRRDGLTTEQTSIISNQPSAPSKQGIMLTVIISVVIALIILLLLSAVFCFRRKHKRLFSQHRLSNDGKADTIELSNIPHIMHEESSEWYALSFKDKRLHQTDDSEVQHHDEDKVNNVFSSSLGILTLHPSSEFIDENVYAEPGPADASEEPLRQTISRQQCTFTPLLDSDV